MAPSTLSLKETLYRKGRKGYAKDAKGIFLGAQRHKFPARALLDRGSRLGAAHPQIHLRVLRVSFASFAVNGSFFLVIHRFRPRGRRIADAAAGEDRLAPAEGGDARSLIGLRQGVGGVGIDDTAQFRFALGDEAAIAGLAPKVAGFLRVGVEGEELRRHAGVMDV